MDLAWFFSAGGDGRSPFCNSWCWDCAELPQVIGTHIPFSFFAADEEMKHCLLCFGRLASERAAEMTEEHLFLCSKRGMAPADCVLYLSAFPAEFGVVLLLRSGCVKPEQRYCSFIYWKKN